MVVVHLVYRPTEPARKEQVRPQGFASDQYDQELPRESTHVTRSVLVMDLASIYQNVLLTVGEISSRPLAECDRSPLTTAFDPIRSYPGMV